MDIQASTGRHVHPTMHTTETSTPLAAFLAGERPPDPCGKCKQECGEATLTSKIWLIVFFDFSLILPLIFGFIFITCALIAHGFRINFAFMIP